MSTREGYQPKEVNSSRKIVPPKGGTGEVKKREEKVLKEQEMRFNEKKVLTMVTANQAIVGDVGWFANTIKDLMKTVQTKDHNFLFLSSRSYSEFFGLVRVIERVDVTEREVES